MVGALLMGPNTGPELAGPAGFLAAAAPRVWWEPRLLINTLLIVAVLLLGALVVAVLNRWRRSSEKALSASEQLSHFRTLYEEGSISQEEFERLRALLGGQLRASLQTPPTKELAPSEKPKPGSVEPPPGPTGPQNPSGPSDPPETGIRPA